MVKKERRFIAYHRVSTQKQGQSGLGLEAQRETVRRYVESKGGKIISPEYVEVETGKRNDRPELTKALKRCRTTGATLVVAKLDRLSRSAAFIMTLRDSGVDFVAVDLPELNTLTLGVMASLAQHERELISERTKAALAAAKARGKRLGGVRGDGHHIRHHYRKGIRAAQAAAQDRLKDVADDLRALRREGLSLNAMARQLNDQGVQSVAGGQWTPTAVSRALARLSAV